MRYFLLVVFILQLAFPDAVYLVDAIEGGKELIQACKPPHLSLIISPKLFMIVKGTARCLVMHLRTFSLLCFLFVLLGDCKLD